jgi:CheY-like chemotaxis protein
MESPARIFVVEDEALFAFYLIMKLKDMGFAVDAALASGEDAVERAQKYRPDLILMDINLAGEMSGIEAVKRIKALFDVPVIFVTGYSDAGIRAQADELNPVAFFVKPVEIKDLEKCITSVLGDRSS